MFAGVRGNEFSLHEFINGVSFLDNTQPQFSPGVSPQIFETVDLMTGGFAPKYATNLSDNRYKIAKESEEIPIQYAPARTLGGSVKFRF